jgi:thioredoxin-like negative regulator of GroEL
LWEPGVEPAPPTATPDVPLYRFAGETALPPPKPLAEAITTLLQPGRDPTVRVVESQQLVALGRVYDARREVAAAAALFEATLAVRPQDDAAAIDLAVTRAQRGDVRGALALVETVLARDPDRYVARLNAARYRLALGDRDGAARDLAAVQATERGRNDPEVRTLHKELER